MKPLKGISCDCGQVTHLIREGKTLRYAENPHGTMGLYNGCFNCHRPLSIPDGPAPPPDTPSGVSAPTPPAPPAAITVEAVEKLKLKAAIEAAAAQCGVDLSAAKNNADRKRLIIEFLQSGDAVDDAATDNIADFDSE